MDKTLCVIGLGYIGLPTSVIFAEHGWNVTGVDINKTVVDTLNDGRVHIKENGLDEMAARVVTAGRLHARLKPVAADVFIIAVPTPHTDDLSADLSYVESAVRSLVPVLAKGNTIIIESTIPPRTTRDIAKPILHAAGFNIGEDLYLAHCPERVLPGRILTELVENNRIIGGIDDRSTNMAADVYRTFVKGKVLETDAESAEMSKLMENTYRDVNIALANEMTKIATELNIDALEVIRLANEHPRVNLHQPGPGVGGHCLAIDPYFIIEKSPEQAKLIRKAREVNESMPMFVASQVQKVVRPGGKIAVFGLAYKGNIDDLRESPALKVVKELADFGFDIQIYDPWIRQEQTMLPLMDRAETLDGAEALLILTDHALFKQLDMKEVAEKMHQPLVIDTKNCVETRSEHVQYVNFGNLHELNACCPAKQ